MRALLVAAALSFGLFGGAVAVFAQNSPEEISEQVFEELIETGVVPNITDLFADSVRPRMVAPMSNVLGQITTMINVYGPVNGYELLETKSLSPKVIYLKYFAYHDALPVTWHWAFYDGAEGWKLVHFVVNDMLGEQL